MASSPSSISGRRNRPGCMGGIAHLFDFNQALAGRKLLTDKKYGAGLEPSRNVANENVEQFKSKTSSRGEIQFGRSASVSRRSTEVPMKALIAEEISQELPREAELKNRAPSVVARLMGLDALPGDRKSEQSPQRGELENLVHKVPSDRLLHGKFLAHNSAGGSKSAGPPTRSVSDLSSSRRSSWEEHAPTLEPLSSQSHSHDQNPREVFDSWKNWKSEDHARMQALDDLDLQLAAKQMLIKKKLSEAKLGLLSKHSGPQEKLYESKEFMDAIDFLQANKDFFARFLEEPDSLFAKHLRSSEENSMPGNAAELVKHTKRRANRAVENGVRAQNRCKEPPDLKRSLYRSSERDDEKLTAGSSLLQPFSVTAQQKPPKSVEYNMNGIVECPQAPTRIVVLKPGPGKVRNLMSLSQNSPRSPREFFDVMEVIKENSMDVLQELKDKLQQEDVRVEPRKARPCVNEHSKLSRDPREIAREIARQVRENVTRDLRAHSKSTTSEIRKIQVSKIADEISGVNASNRGSNGVSGRDSVDKSISNFSGQDPIFDRKSLHRVKEESRRSLDQFHEERRDVWLSEPENAASGRSSCYGDPGQPVNNQGNLKVHGLDATHLNSMIAPHMDSDADSCSYSLCESESDAYARSEERIESAMCITLLRSRSVPTSSSFLHRSQEELRREDQGMLGNGLFVAGSAKVVDLNRSSDATVHQADPLRRSIFSRRGSGLKGSFSKSKKQIKQVDEMPPLPSQQLPTQKSPTHVVDVCSENEKLQHQIDDTGPILDSDSSVSSLDNFLTLEAALIAEDLDGTKVPDSVRPGNVISEKLENSETQERKIELNCQYVDIEENSEISLRSPLESPMKPTSMRDDEPRIADPEGGKDPSEQPSPVSVLDAPFNEESASPMDFREISSGLQELRVRLQLLKFVDQEAVSIQEEYQEEDGDFTDDNRSATIHLRQSVPDFEMAEPDWSSSHMENPDSLIYGIVCPLEKEPELMYVRNLLVASGFTIDSATILTRWHAPSQPLAWYVYERVENSYVASENDSAAYKEVGGGMGSHTRRLIFDSVNEVLLEVLGPQVNCRAWWKSPQKPTILGMPCGKDLVGQVWAGVCKLFCSLSKAQDTLGSLVADDLSSKDRWQDFSHEIEIVVLEVERAIFNDLIQETLKM